MSKLQAIYKFFHIDWVDLADLFKYIHKQPKGYVYRVFHDVLRTYHDDWFPTISKNTTRNYRLFVKYLKCLDIKHNCPSINKDVRNKKFRSSGCSRHRAVAHAFDDLVNLPGNITTTLNSIQSAAGSINDSAEVFLDAMPNIRQSADSVGQLAQQLQTNLPELMQTTQQLQDSAADISSFINMLRTTLDTFKNQFTEYYQNRSAIITSIFDVIVQIFAAAYMLSQEHNQTLTNVIAIFTLIIPRTVTCSIQMFASGLIRVIKGMSGAVAQADDEHDSNFLLSFFKLTVGIIQGLFTDIPKDVFDSLNISNRKLKLIADYLKGTSTIIDFLSKAFSKFMEIIGDKILKYYGVLPSFIKDDTLTPLVDEFLEIKLNRKDQSCVINKEHARQVLQLYESLLKMEAKLQKQNRNNIDLKVTPYLRIMIKTLELSVNRMPDHMRSGVIPRRIKPFWVYIYGDPRIGKSAVVQPYIVSVLAQSMGLIDKYQDYTNYTYLRNCGEDYWEGYANHPVLWYNDLFQNYAQSENMHTAVLELTNIVDDNIYPLNMAFEQKHNVYFNSDLVISNAQDEIIGENFIADKCWSGGSHLYARRNICVCVTLNPAYAKVGGATNANDPGIDYTKMHRYMQANPANCVGYDLCTEHTPLEYDSKLLFPNDLYTMVFTDPMTKSVLRKCDFATAMQCIAQEAHTYSRSQNIFKNKLYDHFEQLFNKGTFRPKAMAGDGDDKGYTLEEVVDDDSDSAINAIVNPPIVDMPQDELTTTTVNNTTNVKIDDVTDEYFDAQTRQPGTVHYVDGSVHAMTADQIITTLTACSRDSMNCPRHEWVEAQLRSAASAIEDALPSLCGVEDFTRLARARVDNNDRLHLLYVWQARGYGRDQFGREADTNARITLAVDILGDELTHNLTTWQKFKARFNLILLKIRNYFRLGFESTTLILMIVQSICIIYLVCKVIQMLGWILAHWSVAWSRRRNCCICNPNRLLDPEPHALFLKGDIKGASQYYQDHILCANCKMSCDEFKPSQTKEKESVAQTAEGKLKTSQPQVLRVKKVNKIAEAQSYDPQNTIVENIVSKQICKFSLIVEENGVLKHERLFGSGLCLGADIFVLPHHFYFRWNEMRQYWESHGLKVTVMLSWNDQLKQRLDWDSIFSYQPQYEHMSDIVFLRIKNLVQKTHIKKFFVSSNDRPILREMYVYGKKATSDNMTMIPVHSGHYGEQVYDHASQTDPLYGGKFCKREIVIPKCVSYYGSLTSNGDCGMMVMHCDSSLNCRKIIGIHTAGVTSQLFGIGSLIFQEDIEETFDYFYPKKDAIDLVAQEYHPVDTDESQRLQAMGLTVLGELPRLVEPQFNVNRVPCLTLPRKTKITKSIVHTIMEEDYGPSTVAPARLRPFEVNGEIVSPFFKAMLKLPRVSPMPPMKYHDAIVEHMGDTVANWHSVYFPRILSDHEAINGYGLLNQIEMSTSPGYPYVVLDNSAGKHPYFEKISENPVQYKMGDYLYSRYREREAMAINNQIMETYFIDTLKDETRPIDKVAIGKTRLFQIAPMDLNILMRKYFGAFLSHCQATFIEGEGSVGINANSEEWTMLIKNCLDVGPDFINGDGENFDASASQPIAMGGVEAINQWYRTGDDWEEWHDRVRRVLWATFLNSRHICRNIVFILVQGNKSGTAVTTWFNILINMYIIRLTYLRLGYDLRYFHKAVRPKFYGDDDLISICRALVPLLTTRAHSETMLSVGIVYTSATKTEQIEFWYTVDQVSYLKRRFHWNGCVYLPQLERKVILEIPRWSESDPDNMTDQMNRFNSALLEMSNYGLDEFSNLRRNFKEYISYIRNMGYFIDVTQLFNYYYCESIKWKFNSPVGLNDLALDSGIDNVVRLDRCASDVKLLTSLADSCEPEDYKTTGNAQTHEGKAKASKPQIIRKPKAMAQSADAEEVDVDFNCYMMMLEHLKELEPCMIAVTRSLERALKRPRAINRLSVLHNKVELMLTIYNDCKRLIVGEGAVAHGETEVPLPQRPQFAAAGITGAVTGAANDKDIVDKQELTTYVDTNAPHQPPIMHNAVPHPNNSNVNMDHSSFLETPLLIDQFNWSPAQPIWAQINHWDFPRAWLNTDAIRSKLAMINFTRPDFEIEIVCNSTKFHYGRLVFVPMPFATNGADFISDAYTSPFVAFTWPNWYQLTAGTGQSLKFIVPYRHFYSQINLTDNSWDHRRFFSLYCYVASPLLSSNVGSGGVTAPVEVSIFARMIKPHFAGRVHTGAVAQGEVEEKERVVDINPIASTSLRVASVGLAGLSRITEDASHFAYKAGFSVPTHLQPTNSMQIRQPLYNKCEDTPNSVFLGPTLASKVVPSREFVNSDEDDMNINTIVGSPALLNVFKITSGTALGSIPWQTILCPTSMNLGGEGVSAPAGTVFPLPMSYLGFMFGLWRGGFKFHFSAVSSGFHSCRLRILYLPGGENANVTLPTTVQEGMLLRNVLWDIAKNSDLTVEVPYEANSHWRFNNVSLANSHSGRIGIQVVNKLTSADPSGVVSPIYIQVFVSATDDFQYNKPITRASDAGLTGHGWCPDIVRPHAQGEYDPCELPASSAMCLRLQQGILLGDINSKHRKYHDSCSFVYTSLKQLCNQLTPLELVTSNTTDAITGIGYTPYGTNWHIYTHNSDWWNVPMHLVVPLFRFMRGSFRVAVLTNEKVQATAWIRNEITDVSALSSHNTDILNFDSTLPATQEPLPFASYGFAHFYDNTLYPIDVTVPYNDIVPCYLTNNGVLNLFDVDKLYIGISTQKSAKRIIVSVAGGDDFILGCRMSIPRVRYADALHLNDLKDVLDTMITASVPHKKHYFRYAKGWHAIHELQDPTFEYRDKDQKGWIAHKTTPLAEWIDRLNEIDVAPEKEENPRIKRSVSGEFPHWPPSDEEIIEDLEDELDEIDGDEPHHQMRRNYLLEMLNKVRNKHL